MNTSELYQEIKSKRRYPNLPVYTWKRQDKEQWRKTQKAVYKRAGGLCESPEDAAPKRAGVCKRELAEKQGHVDHIRPLSSGGSNHISNLRLLCPACHALREDMKHKSMRDSQIKKGSIPVNYKNLLWR
jgi:5-methylcytosine-specific restriction endonuclease McrA